MTEVVNTLPWVSEGRVVPLRVALEHVMTTSNRDGVAERAEEVAEIVARALSRLLDTLVDRGLISAGEALMIADANWHYATTDAPADRS